METIHSPVISLRFKPQLDPHSYKSDYSCCVFVGGSKLAIFGQSYSNNLYEVACYISKCLSYLNINNVNIIHYSNVNVSKIPGIELINTCILEKHTFNIYKELVDTFKVVSCE